MVGAGAIMIRDFTNREGEIGYNINPDYWGKGVATGVARLLITFGIEELNLHRIIMMSANTDVRIFTYMKQKAHRMCLHRVVKYGGNVT
ncbi:GNAT family N-acetyltransferase [Bacillus cereus]|uniref:GNAT family N-acetyltransferase n=1 Tax=Bacillus cereus TaxID=1396 RepID=UPI002239181C|nr:GNAT family N-acetyltransferase [Bacillus cereus]